MFCPQCNGEFREGITRCPTCEVDLVDELTEEEPEYVDWITVLETGDPATLALAKSLLESEDIQYFARGEGVQDLFALGRLGTGFNPVTGPVQLQVDKHDMDTATALLADLIQEERDGKGPSDNEA